MTTATLSYPCKDASQTQYRYRLVQLPSEVAQLFDDGKVNLLTIRGGEDSDAVLTTETSTYAVKEVQTSNTLLLVNLDASQPMLSINEDELSTTAYTVQASLSSTVELEKIVPKSVDQLTHLLVPSTYTGPYHEKKRMQGQSGFNVTLYSWDELRGIVQASDAELKHSLNELGAVEFEGSYRLISPTFLNEFIQLLVASIEIEDKDMNAITEQDALQMMAENEIPESVILHCLSLVADEIEDVGSGIYKLSSSKICRTTGTEVLLSIKNKLPLNTFMKEWRKVTPSTFELSLDCLQGLFLIEETNSMGNEIKYFPKSKLPPIAKDRLDQLFQVRRKWSSHDIMPYIKDLAENKKKLDLMLLKYTRLSKVGETVYYSSRFG
ncbi:UNVERIFIED_CONTAM: hypothetical protein HDU68_002131 [Siphonaria sp. JEL0065]|nr:hypothetical protein HDU68_002131 [Siphonaria sp. JEL0065]